MSIMGHVPFNGFKRFWDVKRFDPFDCFCLADD